MTTTMQNPLDLPDCRISYRKRTRLAGGAHLTTKELRDGHQELRVRFALIMSLALPCLGMAGDDPPKSQGKPANRLAKETSPYLLLHAHNPVDWYPWGPEAFARAKAENKPIFLSVGYSSCYWCHVMERESFVDGEIAKAAERKVRLHQGRSRGAARCRSGLYGGASGFWSRRLAHVGLSDARWPAVFRGNLFSAARPRGRLRLPDGDH